MAEPRRSNEVVFQPKDGKPLKKVLSRYPRVSYRDRAEMSREIEKAARHYWPSTRRVYVQIDGPWQQCRGRISIKTTAGQYLEASFAPVWDPNRPAEEQARPQPDVGKVAPQW